MSIIIRKGALFVLIACFISACQRPLISTVDIPKPQRAEAYIANPQDTRPLLPLAKQKKMAAYYLQKYFRPWDNSIDFRYEDKAHTQPIVSDERGALRSLLVKPTWGANFRQHTKGWVAQLAQNAHLQDFPNRNRRAIVVQNTALRVLPTQEPAFNDYRKAGEGYPFDTLQISAVWVGTPLRVMHFSADGAWGMVVTPTAIGWMSTKDFAYVSDPFVKNWQTHHYVSIIKNHTPLRDAQGHFRFDGRMGTLLPKKAENILIPVVDANQQAEIRMAKISPGVYADFPWLFNKPHAIRLINELLGEPYGWGGIYNYRDCSLTQMDFFTPFGVRLPRNSGAQLRAFRQVDIAEMSPREKEAYLIKRGRPLMTLVGLPGHVTLYIGAKDGHPLIFHNMWGLRTKDFMRNTGRGVVGQTVITPLNFGSWIPGVDITLLQGVRTIAFINEPIGKSQ